MEEDWTDPKVWKKVNPSMGSRNDDYKYAELATQEDFDRF